MPKKIKTDEIKPVELTVEFVPNCRKCQWSLVQQSKKLRKKGILFSACTAQGYTKMSAVYGTFECKKLYQPEKGE